jgi:hypothetical protein
LGSTECKVAARACAPPLAIPAGYAHGNLWQAPPDGGLPPVRSRRAHASRLSLSAGRRRLTCEGRSAAARGQTPSIRPDKRMPASTKATCQKYPHAKLGSGARRCGQAKTVRARPRMCSRRSAAPCRRFSDTRRRADQGPGNSRCAEAPGAARLDGQDRHPRAIFGQKSIAAKIVERGGDYVFPVKNNQKTLRQDIETAFNEPVFPTVLME